MKRRVLSLVITLALCLNLCPGWAMAAGEETGGGPPCPHHPAHTDACGYTPPVPGQACAHVHDSGCTTVRTACTHTHAAECYPSPDADTETAQPSLCAHVCTEDSGCITEVLSCPHVHDGECGYVPEQPGAPCTFVCRVCPVNDLIGQLPDTVSEENSEQVQTQLAAIYALYEELTADEQGQVDMTPCAALLDQFEGLEAAPQSESAAPKGTYDLSDNDTMREIYKVTAPLLITTNGHTLTMAENTYIEVGAGGALELRGTVAGTNGSTIKVLSGGSLTVTDPATSVSGSVSALDIAAGATVSLAAGTYSGKYAAILTEDNNFAALLAPGCAYFDQDGQPIKLTDVVSARTVTVGSCGGHTGRTYSRAPGATSHTWTCPACGKTETEQCHFIFSSDGKGTCACGNTLQISIITDLTNLVYNGASQPGAVQATVTVTDSSNTLTKNTDYKIEYTPRTNAGEGAVEVTGITFDGSFSQTYRVEKDQPTLTWDTATKSVTYDGSPVEADGLPSVSIGIQSNLQADKDNLRTNLQYSYQKSGETAYTDGFPTDAGTYTVKVSLPEQTNFKPAESGTVTLTIDKLDPLVTDPLEKTLTFNGEAQELVTAGTLHSAAVGDGAVIQYRKGPDGTYSTEIPTATDAGTYDVYYKVDATDNCSSVAERWPISVPIAPKPIKPTVKLSKTSYPYDGTKKEPEITVSDGETVLGTDQYSISWGSCDLTSAGKHTVTVSQVPGKNYTFSNVTASLEIVEAVQGALTIIDCPAHVYYGDTFTLNTEGGSDNGTVTWSITGAATITDTGKVTVTGVGSVTVTAEREVANFGPVSDTYSFDVEPKPVTAEVTVAAKDYDGTTAVDTDSITAKVNSGDLVNSSDTVTISGLKGTYDTSSAGTNKTVTIDASAASVTAGSGKYAVSYPAAVKGEIKPKAITVELKLSGNDLQTDTNGDYYYNYDGTEKTPTVTVKDQATGDVIPADEYTVAYRDNKNVGNNATVTVTNRTGGNYTFTGSKTFAIRASGAQLTQSPQPRALTYTGQEQELVDVGAATGGHLEYALDGGEYKETVPKATDAGVYVVKYKVVSDGNHSADEATTTGSVTVTIKQREVISPVIEVQPGPFTYNNKEHEPTVTVKDGSTVIPDREYTRVYRDNIDAGTATVEIRNANGSNYIVNSTATFTIDKDAAEATAPVCKTNLRYTGQPQELITAGSTNDGTLLYALSETGPYSTAIPKGTTRGTYSVWYKVQGDRNHVDSEPQEVTGATIDVNAVQHPIINVTPPSVTYNGGKQEPTVTVQDDEGRFIAIGEYKVTYTKDGSTVDPIDTGTYTLTVAESDTGNYTFNTANTAQFEILPAGQTPLTITGQKVPVAYGDTIQLGTEGGNGTVSWSVSSGAGIAEITNDGLLTVTGVGSVTVTAESTAAGYTDKSAVWSFYADKKQVNAVVTAEAKTYNGDETATVTAVLQGSDLVGTDSFNIKLSGHFEDPNAGTNKKVVVDSSNPDFTGSTGNPANYAITYPGETTASILKADIKPEQVTAPKRPTANLEYTGLSQTLVAKVGSSTAGTVEYSVNDGAYSVAPPSGVGAGDYRIRYRVAGDRNHNDWEDSTANLLVTIDRQAVTDPTVEFTPPGASYDGGVHKPSVTVKDNYGRIIPAEGEYTVTYDPGTDWIQAGDHKVTVTDCTANGGNYDISTKEETFTITQRGQNPLSILNQPGRVQYGDAFTLSASGGSGTGAVTWVSTNTTVATIDQSGNVKVLQAGGPVVITATKEADGNYGASSVTWSFSAEKKPVTPVVTAKDKEFNNSDHADLDITWTPDDLLPADAAAASRVTATGTFISADAGTNKTVVITGLTVPDDIREKYDISYQSTTTASITPKPATVTTAPTKADSLTYNGLEQPLLATPGVAEGGELMYSLDGSSYTLAIPTGTAAKTYTVWYKAAAQDGNHSDSAPVKLGDVVIGPNKGPFTVQCAPSEFAYDGTAKTPTVAVLDNAGRAIPESEYTLTLPEPRSAVGDYTVTVTDRAGGNYEFTSVTGGSFKIVKASQNPLSIITDKPTNLHYGDTFRLSAMGGSGTGAIRWNIEGSAATVDPSSGEVKVTGIGSFTVKAQRDGDGTYGASNEAEVSFYADLKPVTPVVTAANKPYDKTTVATLTATWKSGDILTVDTDTVTITATGAFETPDVGTDKRVSVTGHTETGVDGKYAITWPESTTASIYMVDAKLQTKPSAGAEKRYTGTAQQLVNPGTTEKDIGVIEYSLSEKGEYSTDVPSATNAGRYTVWYRIADSVNYKGIAAAAIETEILQAKPDIMTNPTASQITTGQALSASTLTGGVGSVGGTFAWADGSIKPTEGTFQQDVIFTPADTTNYETVTIQVPVTVQAPDSGSGDSGSGGGSGGGGDSGSVSGAPSAGTDSTPSAGAVSAPLRASVQNGAASASLSASEGSRMVREAAANQSRSIVLKPEITGDVTKSQVSIPASTVSQIGSETDAALTVSAPMADVTIPQAAMDTLGQAGGNLEVVTEQVDQAVVLTLSAGGETVESVPGGVTLSVPAEGAGPGTVAVLVREDGTRETLPKSVVQDGRMNIPLSGSAAVELVDNSKEFADVPADSWAADAVAFASAHELFSGTSETTFSPDQSMSRGMLASVLYNLEGRPEQDVTMEDLSYSDVSGDAWYAESVAWAAENGIATGYGNGQFGPNDSVTREQLVVMLWKYAGSPAAEGGDLSFTDADQASSYAVEALRWAVEKGVLSGYGDGTLLPGGTATRAQAAQMLKNFMENT